MNGIWQRASCLSVFMVLLPPTLHAIAIPAELDTGESVAGALPIIMVVVFLLGIGIGITLQKKMGRPVKFGKPFGQNKHG